MKGLSAIILSKPLHYSILIVNIICQGGNISKTSFSYGNKIGFSLDISFWIKMYANYLGYV